MERLELLEELKKCSEDPLYFIPKHIKVVHPARGLVPFDLYPFQKEIVINLKDRRFNMLRKFRQAGCTTIAAAFAVWMVIFQPNKTVTIISKDDEAAKEVLDRIKVMYRELPFWLKPKIKTDNTHMLRLVNGSKITAKAPSKEAGRSISANLLILDEAAFIENIETIWAAAYPIISTGGAAFVLSTVNGIGNWYYREYQKAIYGRNEFHVMDISWEDHPEYKRQEGYEHFYEEMEQRTPPIHIDDWERITRGNLEPRKWLQEYECAFLGTGDTYISGEILKQLKENCNKNYSRRYNNRMRVWEDPHPYYEYMISVDISLGRGRDYSAFHIFNLYNGEQVAEFYSNKTPINELAKIVNSEGMRYNIAYVIPERNSIGQNLIDKLIDDYEYENLWMDDKGEYGFLTSLKSREILLADMEEAVRCNKVKLNSERTIDELLTFIVNDNGKAEAEESCHDDLVMALGIGSFGLRELRDTTPMEFEQSANFKNPVFPTKSKYSVRTINGEIEEDYLKWILE